MSVTLQGTVGASAKCLITTFPAIMLNGNLPANTQCATSVLKIACSTTTPTTNLELWAGTLAQFQATPVGATFAIAQFASGFPTFAIINPTLLHGLQLYVVRTNGSVDAPFTISIE